jgi:hypothetical protein
LQYDIRLSAELRKFYIQNQTNSGSALVEFSPGSQGKRKEKKSHLLSDKGEWDDKSKEGKPKEFSAVSRKEFVNNLSYVASFFVVPSQK